MAPRKAAPYTKIAILGNFGHGKTTLVASLARSAGRLTRTKPRVEPFGVVSEIADAGLAVNATVMKFRTAARKYALFDFATQNDATKGLVAGPDVDGVILVVSAVAGLQEEASAQMALARKIGIKHVVVVLAVTEQARSKNILPKHEGDIRAMLTKAGFDAAATTITRVSSKPLRLGLHGAGIRELLGTMDSRIPAPTWQSQRPFMMGIDDMLAAESEGLMVFGPLVRGHVQVGAPLEAFGRVGSTRATCGSVDLVLSAVRDGNKTEHLGLLLSPSASWLNDTPYLVAEPGTMTLCRRFIAQVYLLGRSEGGRDDAVRLSWRGQVQALGLKSTGAVIKLPADVVAVPPGAEARLTIQLESKLVMELGTRIVLSEDGAPVGVGVVCNILG